MHTIRYNGAQWEVGYFNPGTSAFNTILTYADMNTAMAWCSYLNGGKNPNDL